MVEASAPLLKELVATLKKGPGKAQCQNGGKYVRVQRAVLLLRCLEHASVTVPRRETMATLWKWAELSHFSCMTLASAVALVRGALAHDLHPGEEALERLVRSCRSQVLGPRVAAAAVEMEQSGGEGGGGRDEGRRFLRELRDRLQPGKSKL
jgi:hypothetical protein